MENAFQRVRDELERMGRTVGSCPFRTNYHIMPPVGWLNDPNGLCQFRGVFHAYFQYSPLNVHGGGGYWGHCVSSDLLCWEYREPVLAADTPEDRSGVYSGSALVEKDRMYLFYTGNVKLPGDYDYIDAGRISTQLLVESGDGQQMSSKEKILGTEDYPADITEHVRDPKVWSEDGHYYMVLGARARRWEDGIRRDKGGILLYCSEDKKHWKLYREIVPQKAFGYMWECPDIFTLSGKKVLSFCPQGLARGEERFQNIYQSGYCLAKPGETLEEALCDSPEDTFREWDMGFDFYAPQTFEAEDGRRILIGWAGVPDTEDVHKNLSVKNGWQHCLTLPGELTLRDGKIFRTPVRELDKLPWQKGIAQENRYHWEDHAVRLFLSEIGGEKREVIIGSRKNGLIIRSEGNKTEISFLDETGKKALCGGGRGRRIGRTRGMVESLLILVDSSIAEIFVNGGEIVFTTRIYLEKAERDMELCRSGKCKLEVV